MLVKIRNRTCALATLIALSLAHFALADAYDPPANYYSAATGTGATLKSQLTTIMSTGHIQRSYGDFRYASAITDADPNAPGKLLTVYTRTSVTAAWDSGSTWNREHTWPDSLQPQNAENSSIGAIADHHMLRPAIPSVNTSRGNSPYGLDNTTGGNGAVAGGYYFPGDADKGDMARTQFYAATRWAAQGFTLVETLPSGTQMGDLSSMINWHFLDTPDTFERRRNQAVFSSALNPNYFTNNRNAYVDRPEYVWSVFVDQLNDSRITIDGATVAADGSAAVNLDLGRVYVGGAVPGPQNFTLNKLGDDGTYFSVTTSGDATSSLGGRFNAFRNGAADSRQMQVGLNTSTATSGIKTGAVAIDNLDVTLSGGLGHGGNDGDDAFNLSLAVLDHPMASFSLDVVQSELTIDLGIIALGQQASTTKSLTNLQAFGAPDFAANLDLDSIVGSGDTDLLFTDLAAFTGLAQGDLAVFDAFFSPTSVGEFSAVYTLNLSDEDLPGEQLQTLTINLLAEAVLAGDFNTDGLVDAADYVVWRDGLDTIYTVEDYEIWKAHFGESAGEAAFSSARVPEPSCLLLLFAATLVAFWHREKFAR